MQRFTGKCYPIGGLIRNPDHRPFYTWNFIYLQVPYLFADPSMKVTKTEQSKLSIKQGKDWLLKTGAIAD